MEEFKPIPGYEGQYQINCNGTIQSCKQRIGNKWENTNEWTAICSNRNKTGHHVIRLSSSGKRQQFLVHRIVLTVFGPPMPFDGALGLHKDDNPDNNHIDNLYWGTSKQNRADAMRSGRAYIPKGEENGKSILTIEQVKEIKEFPKTRGYRIVLASKYGVTIATIKDVVSGRSWAAVDCENPAPRTYGTGPDAGRIR